MSKEIDIRLGDIAYPKSKAMIIPGNTVGLMTRGIAKRVLKDSLGTVKKEAKRVAEEEKPEVGTCFKTVPGRLKRRGLEEIYHAVIKRFPNDMTTIKIIEDCLDYTLEQAVKDEYPSISLCGLGIEDGDIEVSLAARRILSICEKHSSNIDIKIIDDNPKFIAELKKLLGVDK